MSEAGPEALVVAPALIPAAPGLYLARYAEPTRVRWSRWLARPPGCRFQHVKVCSY